MMQKTIRFIQEEPLVWGPIFLLFAIGLAIKIAIPFELVFLGSVGFFLSAKLQLRGCCYALILLAISSIFRHALLVDDHLWQLGIEGSFGLAFFITALAHAQGSLWVQSLESQIETRQAAVENLEEDLAKTKEAAQDQQIIFQEKVANLQKEFEELQAEHSSILILNEVLRKTTANKNQETDEAKKALYDAKINIEHLKTELANCENHIAYLKSSDLLVQQNEELLNELNSARFEKEQTHLINEALVRLHLKETLKAKESESEASSLKEQLQAAHQEIRRIKEPLEEKLKEAYKEIATLKLEFEKTQNQANRVREELLKLHEIQEERNFLKERLDTAMLELEKEKPKMDLGLMEKLKFAEEKIYHLSQIEPLFKQLKKQFDEKNQVLHQTRAELFKTDTELQKLKIEMSALDFIPLPKGVEEELETLVLQVEVLEEENRQLHEFITSSKNLSERKKKVKIRRPPPDQTLLF